MSERDNMLARIREALAVPAPMPGHDHDPARPTPVLPTAADQRRVLPAMGQSFDEQIALFGRNAADLRADFRLVKDLDALAAELKGICAAESWQRAASHGGELTGAACQALGLPVLLTDQAFDKRELARCDVGISDCDALVAQTGSVVVNEPERGRAGAFGAAAASRRSGAARADWCPICRRPLRWSKRSTARVTRA